MGGAAKGHRPPDRGAKRVLVVRPPKHPVETKLRIVLSVLCLGEQTAATLIVGQCGQIAVGHGPGIVLLLLSALSWPVGAVLSQRLPLPADPLGSVAIQMLAGGAAIIAVAIATGEGSRVHLSTLSTPSWLAFGYLTIPGAVVAYTAFARLLQNGPHATVNTYAYVSPLIAVILGWAILGEQIKPLTALGGAVVVGSVVSTVRQTARGSS